MLSFALPEPARADDRVQECIGEHVEAQLLRKQGRWIEARDHLLECSLPTCPALVREECSALTREIDSGLPSIILRALDADGRPTNEPLVSIDGATELIPLDGRPVSLDPGEHQIRFEHPEDGSRDVTLVLAESEHDRSVLADFRPIEDRGGAPSERRWPSTVMLVSGGVAAAALGSFTFFALSGRSVQSELERCQPACENRAEIDRMRSRYAIADVSLGVALVSIGIGAYAWTQHPSASTSGAAPSASRGGVRLHPIATSDGAGIWATGEF
ncbi:MAG TPA: hypothetical protein VMG12_18875 [Polyangiaceae bacterium]|nr:hypothetical protein [Polyangiaceae bacterium]